MGTMMTRWIAPILAAAAVAAPAQDEQPVLSSGAFTAQGAIPKQYTCDGKDVSPPLSWSKLPAGTKSLALVIEDPDAPDPAAPQMVWVHWILYNLPPDPPRLAAGASGAGLHGAKQGLNDWKQPRYRGPCPPIGVHRYVHTLYALDATLDVPPIRTKSELEHALQGHVLGKATLVGLYGRGR